MPIRKTSKKTIHIIDTYHINDNIKYCIEFKNSKEIKRYLKYNGPKHYEYELAPLYQSDLSLLSKTNPFWFKTEDDSNWMKGESLPNPEDIDLSKIIYLQGSRHAFYDLNKKPIPVIYHGDYIGANLDNKTYHLKALREYLLTHPNIVSVSEIMDIPYYNAEKKRTKYIEVFGIPTSEAIQYGLDNKLHGYEILFGRPYEREDTYESIFKKPYEKEKRDFLGIKQFLK